MAVQRVSRGFKDISLSFNAHPITKDIPVLKNERAIIRSVRNLVETIPTERFFSSDIGSNVRSSLFNFVDFGTAEVIKSEIESVVDNYEPRVENLQVYVDPQPDNIREKRLRYVSTDDWQIDTLCFWDLVEV